MAKVEIYLETAFSVYPDIETIGLTEASYKTPLDMREFLLWQTTSELWNLQLFTQIISFVFFEPKRKECLVWEEEFKERRGARYAIKYSFLARLKVSLFNKALGFLSVKAEVLLPSTLFPRSIILKLCLLSRGKILPVVASPDKTHFNSDNETILNKVKRETLTSLADDDMFVSLVLHTLKINMPMIFIENYQGVHESAIKRYPQKVSVILNQSLFFPKACYKFWCAYMIEQGTKTVGLQHGGGYGISEYGASEYLEKKEDYFISWGWKHQEDRNVIPLPSPKISLEYKERAWDSRSSKNTLILWITNTHAAPYFPFLFPHPYYYKNYIAWQFRFYQALESALYKEMNMRLGPGSKLREYYKENFLKMEISSPNERDSFYAQLYKTKICVVDTCQTTFLYCLAFNIPTILFWDQDVTKIREAAKPWFKDFERLKIYHSTPESAAKMLNEISNNPSEWWNNKELQKVRLDFCNQFAKLRPGWLKEFSETLVKKAECEVNHTHS